MKKNLLFLLGTLLLATSCNKDSMSSNTATYGEEITIGISTQSEGITYEPLGSKSVESGDLIAMQIFQVEDGTETPYAQGLFESLDGLSFKGTSGATYKVVSTIVKDGVNTIEKSDDIYAKPFESATSSEFTYTTEEMEGISTSTATLTDGEEYTVPSIDRYYGLTSKLVTADDASISISLKRMSFGFAIDADDQITSDFIVSIAGAPEVTFTSEDDFFIFSHSDIVAAYEFDESDESYSETLDVVITTSDNASYFDGEISFQRNKLATVAANYINGEIVFELEVPFEDKVAVISDNLYYNEIQLASSYTYWVNAEGNNADNVIKWYLDNELVATGTEYTYTPTAAGSYDIKYTIAQAYSTTGEEVTKVVSPKAYSSTGVYILNEPNMTGAETIRGINKHVWGEDSVTRFVEGDYTMFGSTNQYIQNWAGKLYVVASYPQSGVSFSRFDALTGEFDSAHESVNGAASAELRSFAGISPSLGVIALKSGAYLVDLDNFTVESTELKNSADAKNMLVSDGYLFVICTNGAIAYKIDGLSTDTEPIVLGSATAGFVKSKDGNIWAASGNTLLCIDPKTLEVSTRSIPNSLTISFSSSPWKQVSWVASTTENCFYFTKDSWGTAYYVYKYDIDAETADTFLEKEDFDSYMLYATSLHFDAQRNELVCQGIKGYGTSSYYNGIWGYDGSTETKSFGVIYDTTDDNVYGDKDMFFPAMMAPIKNY